MRCPTTGISISRLNSSITYAYTDLSNDFTIANSCYSIYIILVTTISNYLLRNPEFPVNYLIVNHDVVSIEDWLTAAHPVEAGINHLRTSRVTAVLRRKNQLGGGRVHRGGVPVDIDISHGADCVAHLTIVVVAVCIGVRLKDEVCISQHREITFDSIYRANTGRSSVGKVS